jgi:hypothetical protein
MERQNDSRLPRTMAWFELIEGEDMLTSVKGKFKNGVARPLEEVEGREDQPVVIVFLEESYVEAASREIGWDTLTQLVDKCAVETGINDLAHQHDHYLYNKPKEE